MVKRRVVYIDKPFVPRQMTTRQRNEWGHKFTVKHTVWNKFHSAKFLEKPDEAGNLFEFTGQFMCLQQRSFFCDGFDAYGILFRIS